MESLGLGDRCRASDTRHPFWQPADAANLPL